MKTLEDLEITQKPLKSLEIPCNHLTSLDVNDVLVLRGVLGVIDGLDVIDDLDVIGVINILDVLDLLYVLKNP